MHTLLNIEYTKVLKMGLPSRVGYEHVGEPLRESLPEDLKQQFVRYGESSCGVARYDTSLNGLRTPEGDQCAALGC